MYECVLNCLCNMIGLSANSQEALSRALGAHRCCVVDQNPISVTYIPCFMFTCV